MISIVIANYNYAEFVGKAVESALGQRNVNVEVIAVDDGSTDDSVAVLQHYRVEGLQVLVQENRGHAGAFNAGYAAARGDLVIFLDADDVLLPDAAATAAGAADSGQVVQVHWPVAEIDGRGEPTGEVTPVAELAEGDLLPQLLDAGPLQWSSSPTSGNAWTRAYLDLVMPIPEAEFRMGADAYLIGLAPLYGQVNALGRPYSQYRRHGANHSAASFDSVLQFDMDIARKLSGVAAARARALGFDVDTDQWEQRNWSSMLARSLAEIDVLIGRTVPFVLIDGMQLSLDRTSGRCVIPFLERDGEYWGDPEDDTHAIVELKRLRREGARYLVLAWPAFWWTDTYPVFIEHVRQHCPCRLENDRLQVFELSA